MANWMTSGRGLGRGGTNIQRAVRIGCGGLLALALTGCVLGDDGPDCSLSGRNRFVYHLMRDYYYWAEQTPTLDPDTYESPVAVLNAMAYRIVDRWSGIQPAVQRKQLFNEGKYLGFGLQMLWDSIGLRVAMVHQDSPAGRAGITRGMLIEAIAGVPIDVINQDRLWNTIWGPEEPGVEVSITVRDLTGTQHEIPMQKDWVKIQTVHQTAVLERGERRVGYMNFTGFLGTSAAELREAFAEFKTAAIDELVLDLRYNGGGLLSAATVLASLIVDPDKAEQLFTRITYNSRHSEANSDLNFTKEDNALGLGRLYVLVGPGTASASELLINGLRSYIPVSVIGTRTHGKPVGANTWEHCGEAITPITFKTVNAENQGEYFKGLVAECVVHDDLDHPLGSPEEARMANALDLMESETCRRGIERPALPGFPENLAELEPGEFMRERLLRRSEQDEFGLF